MVYEDESLILQDYPDEDVELIITVMIGKKKKYGVVQCMTGMMIHSIKNKDEALSLCRHGADVAMDKIFEKIKEELP
jgi:hypothetical protein